MASIYLIDPARAASAQSAPPVTSLKSKVTSVAIAVLTAAIIGAGAFLISSSLPISLTAGVIALLLLCAWIYYLNRNAPSPEEIEPQEPPVIEEPLPEPVIPTDIPVAQEVIAWQKKLLFCIDSARGNCTPEKVEAFRDLLQKMPDHINDPQKENPLHPTILHYLATCGPAPFVAVMAEFNVDFGIQEIGIFGNSALHRAIANGKNGTALEIIKHAPSQTLSLQSQNGNTPLHLAVAKGYTTHTHDGQPIDCTNFVLTEALITKDAIVNISNEDGNTPLHLACARRDIATMQLLIDKGAKTDTRNNKNQTPWNLLNLEYAQACELLTYAVTAFILEKEPFENSKQKAKDILLYAEASPDLRKEIDRNRRLIGNQMKRIASGSLY